MRDREPDFIFAIPASVQKVGKTPVAKVTLLDKKRTSMLSSRDFGIGRGKNSGILDEIFNHANDQAFVPVMADAATGEKSPIGHGIRAERNFL